MKIQEMSCVERQNIGDKKMINIMEVSETNKMVEHENLDVRTITIGISLFGLY